MLLQIEESDILIGIFWKRLGTPLHDARSGTEHELRTALGAWHRRQAPQIMLYFRDTRTETTEPEDLEQLERLREFRRELIETEKPLVWPYDDLASFRESVRNHLLMYVAEIAQRTSTGGHSLKKVCSVPRRRKPPERKK